MGADLEREINDLTLVSGQVQFDKYHFTGRGFSFPGASIDDDPYALMNMTQDQNTLHGGVHLNYTGFQRTTICWAPGTSTSRTSPPGSALSIRTTCP